ncbi:MAG: shikimate dehydrogenase [Gammaproteobacteria bacterium TMED1]|jgi:shikimate dehydrogenase|nr:MAG: shikimate dehydrogenase [Gammaproteobacteria bacterium TMED1]|tara:strand:+ start:11915 stop:12736 length:822 start_codon:yes stop_codon:yes gene_type:complete
MKYQLAVLGNPIAHSRSPEIHKKFAEQHRLEVSFDRILVPFNSFDNCASDFIQSGGKGFNVTAPCKQDAFRFSVTHSKAAELAQAVNTISTRDGVIHGDNTDGAGLKQDIIVNLGWTIEGKKILMLGAGGAASGVVGDLLASNPNSLHILNRTFNKAQAIERLHSDHRLTAITTLDMTYDLIINATSAAFNDERLDLPPSILCDSSCCYDLTYGRKVNETPFLIWSKGLGVTSVSDGLGMLVEQAAQAFEIWFGRNVLTAPVIESMRENGTTS